MEIGIRYFINYFKCICDISIRYRQIYVHKELGKTGVTLEMLHVEYADACAREGGVPMSYATFWRGYSAGFLRARTGRSRRA